MKMLSLSEELKGNSYPGRGIVIGRSEDGTKAVTAYFIMGRSVNSRNRVFVTEGGRCRKDHTVGGTVICCCIVYPAANRSFFCTLR